MVFYCKMDAGFERGVERLYSISGEKEDPFIILEQAKENCPRLVKRCISKISLSKDLLETRLFLSRSLVLRCSRKTSASSMRTIAFHEVARSRAACRFSSTIAGDIPSSPQLIVYRGLLVISATLSVKIISGFPLEMNCDDGPTCGKGLANSRNSMQ
jgi:hypothetical protein